MSHRESDSREHVSVTSDSGKPSSLRWWVAAVIVLALLTVVILPISVGSKVWIIAMLAFAAVFTVLEIGSKGASWPPSWSLCSRSILACRSNERCCC